MYRNIGKKIKALSIVFFILMALGCFVTGLILLIEAGSVLLAIPIMIVGPLFAWIGSWLLYGFGELVDKAAEIARNTAGGVSAAPSAAQAAYDAPAPAQPQQPQKPQAPAHSPEFMQRLAKLQALNTQGIITDEEYDVALAKLRAEEQK